MRVRVRMRVKGEGEGEGEGKGEGYALRGACPRGEAVQEARRSWVASSTASDLLPASQGPPRTCCLLTLARLGPAAC